MEDTSTIAAASIACRIGIMYIHMSIIPSMNVNSVVIQHILNATIITFNFFFFGYQLSWMKNVLDFFSTWTLQNCIDTQKYFETWKNALVSEGLISIMLVGRSHLLLNVVVIYALSIVHPILFNLFTNSTTLNELRKQLFQIEDEEYLGLLHIFPGGFALVSSLLFGKRALALEEIDPNSLPINAQAFSLLGYFLASVGFAFEQEMTKIQIAVVTGMLISMILLFTIHWEMDYWATVKILQTIVVSIIGTIYCSHLPETMILSAISFVTWALLSKVIKILGVEDNCSIIITHGIVASISLTYSAMSKGQPWYNILMAATTACAMFFLGMLFGIITLLPFKVLGIFRSREEKLSHRLSKDLNNSKKRQQGKFQPGSHMLKGLIPEQGKSKRTKITNEGDVQ